MINIFTWNESLATGFEEVDLQHKKLIHIIDDVNSKILSSPEEYAMQMSKVIKQLTDYTLYHFFEEEKFMKSYNYPEYETHKKEHEAFVMQVRAQIPTLAQSNPDNGYNFYRFLGSWLLSHIAKEDQKWAAFIRDAQNK
jgi:hemerythrin